MQAAQVMGQTIQVQKETLEEKLERAIDLLAKRISPHVKPLDAQHYSQAALNFSYALRNIKNGVPEAHFKPKGEAD